MSLPWWFVYGFWMAALAASAIGHLRKGHDWWAALWVAVMMVVTMLTMQSHVLAVEPAPRPTVTVLGPASPGHCGAVAELYWSVGRAHDCGEGER